MKKWIAALAFSLAVVSVAKAADSTTLERKFSSGITLGSLKKLSTDAQVALVFGVYFSMMQTRALAGQTVCVPLDDLGQADSVVILLGRLQSFAANHEDMAGTPIESAVYGVACTLWPEKKQSQLGS